MIAVRWHILVALAAVLPAVFAAPLAAHADAALVPALLSRLAVDGWSQQQTAALSDAANLLDWTGTQAVDPRVPALALEMERGQAGILPPDGQAQLALQIALSTAELNAVGIDDHAAAAAALDAVRGMLAAIQAWAAAGRQGDLGPLIRKSVADAVRRQGQSAAGSQVAGGASVTHDLSNPGGPPDVTTPAHGGGFIPPGLAR